MRRASVALCKEARGGLTLSQRPWWPLLQVNSHARHSGVGPSAGVRSQGPRSIHGVPRCGCGSVGGRISPAACSWADEVLGKCTVSPGQPRQGPAARRAQPSDAAREQLGRARAHRAPRVGHRRSGWRIVPPCSPPPPTPSPSSLFACRAAGPGPSGLNTSPPWRPAYCAPGEDLISSAKLAADPLTGRLAVGPHHAHPERTKAHHLEGAPEKHTLRVLCRPLCVNTEDWTQSATNLRLRPVSTRVHE